MVQQRKGSSLFKTDTIVTLGKFFLLVSNVFLQDCCYAAYWIEEVCSALCYLLTSSLDCIGEGHHVTQQQEQQKQQE